VPNGKQLAWVIIGGLISSLFLTLIIVPVIYEIMEKLIYKFTKGKTNFDALMVADYEPQVLSEDVYNDDNKRVVVSFSV
jgi:HAE1 family hydrophobic/amphiphilic exporter-1